MPSPNDYVPTAVATGIAAIGAIVAWKTFNATVRGKYLPNENDYKYVGKVSNLVLYPIKSGKKTELQSAQCTTLGLKSGDARDREFMIVQDDLTFLSGRQEPTMMQIASVIDKDNLHLSGPGMDPITVPIPRNSKQTIICDLRGEKIPALDMGNTVSNWLAKYFDRPGVRLVYFPENSSRRIARDWDKWERLKKNDNAIFADRTAYMLLSKPSFEDLNRRLTDKVTIHHYRPNIIVDGCAAYAEDKWKYIKIGNVVLRNVKPCARCILTTYNPDTGVKDGDESLKTLTSYRLNDDLVLRAVDLNRPMFGIHLQADAVGSINVGDEVYAVS